ncbi:MAG: hypothetical protein CM1200mP41_28700 [Gammaproteobacteria bacterium]|nr:MAG: hypothetical protein CM1200mP41_28700 [Gammaproteobacteria bacterium]
MSRIKRWLVPISLQLAKLWIFAEILLFVLVGAQVDLRVAMASGLAGALLIVLGLVARSVGTWLCLLRSAFNRQKAVVCGDRCLAQGDGAGGDWRRCFGCARAGGRPTDPGEVILAVAVLSILLTAPVGAWAISWSGERWLSEDESGIKSPVPADNY